MISLYGSESERLSPYSLGTARSGVSSEIFSNAAVHEKGTENVWRICNLGGSAQDLQDVRTCWRAVALDVIKDDLAESDG